MSEPQPPCPIDCPNRRKDGLTAFGIRVTPVEILLHTALIVVVGLPASKAAVSPNFTVIDSLKWLSAFVGGSTFIALTPNDRLEAWLRVKGK